MNIQDRIIRPIKNEFFFIKSKLSVIKGWSLLNDAKRGQKRQTSCRRNSTTTQPFEVLLAAKLIWQWTLWSLCSNDRQLSVKKSKVFIKGEHTVGHYRDVQYQNSFVRFWTHQSLCYYGWTYEISSCACKIRKFPNCCLSMYIFLRMTLLKFMSFPS